MNPLITLGRRQAAALVGAGLLALVAACGGGGSSSDATAPGATPSSFSSGVISGFGSVIVNGVRWDDSSAAVTDDDGNRKSRSDLKLGMTVEVDGGPVNKSAATGVAMAIRYGAETLGPVTSVDTAASTLVVLGQTVEVTASTVFGESITGGLAGITAGAVVEVHGLYDAAAAKVVATRIEVKTGVTEYRLRGTLSALDTAGKTFKLGSETISYASAEIPTGFTLANDVQVKVRLQTAQVAGAWVANKVRPIARALGKENRPDAEVEGVITVFTSATSFEINGLKVDASNATFPDGTTGIALGARVEVKGAVVDGVLVATAVEVEDEHHGGPSREFELHGTVGTLKTADKTFVLRGVTVDYANVTTWKDGDASKLAEGVKVEVKGTLSADKTRVAATRISFE